MNCLAVRKTLLISTTFCLNLALIGCGHSLSGTYSGKGTGFLDKLHFKSGGKVELTFMGMTKEGSYEIEGNKVKVTNAGDTQVLTIDAQGCLDGGGLLGKYCKDGTAVASSAGVSGTYVAGDASGGIKLEFRDGNKVRVTVADAGARGETAEGEYQVSGDRITVQVPRGERLVLTRNGDTLEGSFGGANKINFVKR